jgi:LuxR family maltose regulon positive regulatory protein
VLFYKKFFTTAFEALSTEDEYSEYCRKIMKLADDLKSGHKPVTGTDKREANTANGLKALLTEREYKIATLAAHMMTNKEIATQMFLAEGTVRNQLSKVFEKLDIEGDTRNKRMELEKLLFSPCFLAAFAQIQQITRFCLTKTRVL